jgi:hypothetical protein
MDSGSRLQRRLSSMRSLGLIGFEFRLRANKLVLKSSWLQ